MSTGGWFSPSRLRAAPEREGDSDERSSWTGSDDEEDERRHQQASAGLEEQLWSCVGDKLRRSFMTTASSSRAAEGGGGIAVDDFVVVLMDALYEQCGTLSTEGEARLRRRLFRLFQLCSEDAQRVTWEQFTGHLVDEAWRAGATATDTGVITEKYHHVRTMKFATTGAKVRVNKARVPRRKEVTVEKIEECVHRMDQEGNSFDLHAFLEEIDADKTDEFDSRHEPLHRLWHFPRWGDAQGRALAAGKFNTVTVRNSGDLKMIMPLPRTSVTIFAAAYLPLSPTQYLATAHRDGSLRFYSINEKNIKVGIECGTCCQAPSPIQSLAWSSKHDRLFSGGQNGEVCQWSMTGIDDSPRRGNRGSGGPDLLSAFALIHGAGVQKQLQEMARLHIAGAAVTAGEARQRAAALVQLFGLQTGDGLYVAEQPADDAARYVAALAQLSGWNAQGLESAFQGLEAKAGVPAAVSAKNVAGSGCGAKDRRLFHMRQAHTDSVTAIVLDAEGRLVTASKDASVSFFDIELGDTLYTLRHHERGILTMAFAEPTHQLVTGGWEFTPLVWNANSPLERPTRLVDASQPHQHHIVSVCCPSDRPQIISADAKALVKIWDSRMLRQSMQTIDVARGLPAGDWQKHYLTDLCYVPHESQLVVTGRNTYTFHCRSSSDPHNAADVALTAALYCGETKSFITAAGPHIRVWNARDGKVGGTFDAAPSKVTVTALDINPRGSHFFYGCSDGSVKQLKSATGDVLRDHGRVVGGEVAAVVYCSRPAPLKDMVVCAGRGGRLFFVTDDQRIPKTYKFASVQGDVSPTCVCDCPVLQLIAVGTAESKLLMIDVSILTARGPIHKINAVVEDGGEPIGHITVCCSIGRNPCVAVGDASGHLGVFGVRPYPFAGWHAPLARWDNCIDFDERRLRPAVTAMTGVPNANVIVTGSEKGVLVAWDLTAAFEVCAVRPVMRALQVVVDVFTKQNEQVPRAAPETVKMLWRQTTHKAEVTSLRVLPAQAALLSAGLDLKVRISHLETGIPICSLQQGRGVGGPLLIRRGQKDEAKKKEEAWEFDVGHGGRDLAQRWSAVGKMVNAAKKRWKKAGVSPPRTATDVVTPEWAKSPPAQQLPARRAGARGTINRRSPLSVLTEQHPRPEGRRRRTQVSPASESLGTPEPGRLSVTPAPLLHLEGSLHIPSSLDARSDDSTVTDPGPRLCTTAAATDAGSRRTKSHSPGGIADDETEGRTEDSAETGHTSAPHVVVDGEWISHDWYAAHGGERCRISARSDGLIAYKLAAGHPHVPVGSVTWKTQLVPGADEWVQGSAQVRSSITHAADWRPIVVHLSASGTEITLVGVSSEPGGSHRGTFERHSKDMDTRKVALPAPMSIWGADGNEWNALAERCALTPSAPQQVFRGGELQEDTGPERNRALQAADALTPLERAGATDQMMEQWVGQLCIMRLKGALPEPGVRGPAVASVEVPEPSPRLVHGCVAAQWQKEGDDLRRAVQQRQTELSKMTAPGRLQTEAIRAEAAQPAPDVIHAVENDPPEEPLAAYGGAGCSVSRRKRTPRPSAPEDTPQPSEQASEAGPEVGEGDVAAVEDDAMKQSIRVTFDFKLPVSRASTSTTPTPSAPFRPTPPPRARSAGASTPQPRRLISTSAARHWRGGFVASETRGRSPPAPPLESEWREAAASSPDKQLPEKEAHSGARWLPSGVRRVVVASKSSVSVRNDRPPARTPRPPVRQQARPKPAPPVLQHEHRRRSASAAALACWEDEEFAAAVQKYLRRDATVPQRYRRLFEV
eukprot:TRINITY_DN36144_c0_g1_i1.p1 TRINITY_DN36144_c0_g1~~TRINITY_DN36144_c0_g1_i1.p1  ORF type:complete len:1782 (+),score=411.02 TRINITY_DN36144_c0_g1_i1:50-5395(+)